MIALGRPKFGNQIDMWLPWGLNKQINVKTSQKDNKQCLVWFLTLLCSELAQICPAMSSPVQICPVMSKYIQICSAMSGRVQIGPVISSSRNCFQACRHQQLLSKADTNPIQNKNTENYPTPYRPFSKHIG